MQTMNYTKLSQNPNFGRPSGAKLAARMRGWRRWEQGMKLLRSIHVEIQDKLADMKAASIRLDESVKL
jgi:hypothetical protein